MKKPKRKPLKRSRTSGSSAFLKAVSILMASMLGYGGYNALDAVGLVPSYKTPLDVAIERLDKERTAIEKAKKDIPELYPEPVEFYLKTDIEEVERLRKKENRPADRPK